MDTDGSIVLNYNSNRIEWRLTPKNKLSHKDALSSHSQEHELWRLTPKNKPAFRYRTWRKTATTATRADPRFYTCPPAAEPQHATAEPYSNTCPPAAEQQHTKANPCSTLAHLQQSNSTRSICSHHHSSLLPLTS